MTVRLLDFAITDEGKELQPLNRIEHHKGPLYVSGNRLLFLLRDLKALWSIAEGSREPDLEFRSPVFFRQPCLLGGQPPPFLTLGYTYCVPYIVVSC